MAMLPAHDRADRPAFDLPPGEGSPPRFAADPLIVDDALAFEVDDGQVGVVAERDAALAGDAENALRPGAGQIDEARQAEAPR